MSAAIFYPGFICGAYPAIVLAQRYPIERVIFGIVLLWGMPSYVFVLAAFCWDSVSPRR